MGFGGGWYVRYYYPGYGMGLSDNDLNRHPLSGRYLGYWGGRRAWWKHRGDRGGHWNGGKSHGQHHEARPPRPNRPDRPDRPNRPGKWNGHDRDHDGPRGPAPRPGGGAGHPPARSEEHTSELQSLMRISYAVFCLKKKTTRKKQKKNNIRGNKHKTDNNSTH